jgi:Flp pilus assembly protein TadG
MKGGGKAVRRKNGRSGSSIIEMVLISPWIFFLFIGALDWGFYSSALISVEAAAHSAALYTSTSAGTSADSSGARTIVVKELANVPNVTDDNPVVTATSLTGAASPDGAAATQVSVQYTTISLIPIPGLLKQQFTFTRIVTMRVKT